jgi:alkenylglycerophosphocholine/alkenylglycerophosphoethanolamine hydrolase
MRGEWLALALVFALGDWYAVAAGNSRIRAFTKPAVMLALLAGFTLVGGWQAPTLWFGLGLIFSLTGDVLLMLPPGFFIGGLLSFLIGHVMYVLGFMHGFIFQGWIVLFPLILLAMIDCLIYLRLRRALLAREKGRWLRFPVLIYLVVISLMFLSALLTLQRSDWPRPAAWLAAAGALLFLISDTVLANNRFVSPIRGGRVIVIITYHLGQIALIAGALLRV